MEQSIRASHPYDVFMLRSMLAVPYFEKAGPLAHFYICHCELQLLQAVTITTSRQAWVPRVHLLA